MNFNQKESRQHLKLKHVFHYRGNTFFVYSRNQKKTIEQDCKSFILKNI